MSSNNRIIKLEKEESKHYLRSLYTALKTLDYELTESNILKPAIMSYHKAFTDLIGLSASAPDFKYFNNLTLAVNSGLPMYSKIHYLIDQQKRDFTADLEQKRDPKEISADLMNAIYGNDDKLVKIYQKELQTVNYLLRLKKFTDLKEIVELSEMSGFEDERISKYRFECATYSTALMSCVSLYANVTKAKGLFSSKVKIADFKKNLELPLPVTYVNLRTKKIHPETLIQSKMKFYFNGIKTNNPELDNLLEKEPETYVLAFQTSVLEDLDAFLATEVDDLDNDIEEDYGITDEAIFVTNSKNIEKIAEILTQNRLNFKVIQAKEM